MILSKIAFALSARGGLPRIRMPSAVNTASNEPVNCPARSLIWHNRPPGERWPGSVAGCIDPCGLSGKERGALEPVLFGGLDRVQAGRELAISQLDVAALLRARTVQRLQAVFAALICCSAGPAAAMGKNSSGSSRWHAPRDIQPREPVRPSTAARHASGRPALVLGTGVGAGHEVALTARPPLACRCVDQVQGQLAARPGQESGPGQAWPGPVPVSSPPPGVTMTRWPRGCLGCRSDCPSRRIGRTVTSGTVALRWAWLNVRSRLLLLWTPGGT